MIMATGQSGNIETVTNPTSDFRSQNCLSPDDGAALGLFALRVRKKPARTMHLKEIVLEGFKSYAVRTVVSGFDREFNAITGLNGSGKSNILDSICFVLGISNLTQVRAGRAATGASAGPPHLRRNVAGRKLSDGVALPAPGVSRGPARARIARLPCCDDCSPPLPALLQLLMCGAPLAVARCFSGPRRQPARARVQAGPGGRAEGERDADLQQ